MTDDRTQWGDSRLDELARRVEQSATREDVSNLRRALDQANQDMRRELAGGVDGVRAQVVDVGKKVDHLATSVMGDPVSERRVRNQAAVVAVIGAAAGGFMTFVVFVVSGGLH